MARKLTVSPATREAISVAEAPVDLPPPASVAAAPDAWTRIPPLDAGWYWWADGHRYVRPLRVFLDGNGTLTVEYVGRDVPLAAFHTDATWWAGPLVVPAPPGG